MNSVSSVEASPVSTSAPSLPDPNAQMYPFDMVQELLEQTAYFNLYSTPDGDRGNSPILSGSGGVTGIRVSGRLHAFNAEMSPPSRAEGIKTSNTLGKQAGRLTMRWLLIPEDYWAEPGKEPPPTELNREVSQRFVMLDPELRLDERDGFRGFGTGRTFPLQSSGQSYLHFTGVGVILEGFGKFAGHQGLFVISGHVSAKHGFYVNVVVRVTDADGNLRTDTPLPTTTRGLSPDRDTTYLFFFAQKDARYPTTYRLGSDGQVEGLNVREKLRLARLAFTADRDLRSYAKLGQGIGENSLTVVFNPFNPGAPGTPTSPIVFTSPNQLYTFVDETGETVGSIQGDIVEAREFNTQLPGAPGLPAFLFAGFGPIHSGTGAFSGAQGFLYFNSAGTIGPHVVSDLYVLQLVDPQGKFRER
jgi:hypothetical protein